MLRVGMRKFFRNTILLVVFGILVALYMHAALAAIA